MPKYIVYGIVTATKFIGEFEAEDKEKAEEKAWESIGSDSVSLCHHCAKEIDEPTISRIEVEEIK